MGEKTNPCDVLVRKPEKNHLEDVDTDGIMEWMAECATGLI